MIKDQVINFEKEKMKYGLSAVEAYKRRMRRIQVILKVRLIQEAIHIKSSVN